MSFNKDNEEVIFEQGVKLLTPFHCVIVGEYWVDPNGGCKDDAILVYCDFEHNATCINPKQKEVGRV